MLRTITCRLYPTPAQTSRLFHFLHVGRKLFNDGLSQRINHYKETGNGLGHYTQTADLTILRSVSPTLRDVPVEIGRDALSRLDKAFKAFFRRVKDKSGKAGFPRFKSFRRWNSFAIGVNVQKVLVGNRVRVSGVNGLIRARNVRPPEGKIKQQRIVHRAGKWYCQLVVDDGRQPPPTQPILSAVGIDVGLNSFAVLSTGENVANPRFGRKLQRKLARTHRSVSRKVKGSRNRHKAIRGLQRVYVKIADARWNFAHHLSKRIVAEFQFIAVEKLQIREMARGHFAKSILDAAWGQFLWQLKYKAESAGVLYCEVNPRGTSQECSQCGKTIGKNLSQRAHWCTGCGFMVGRDHNAALNILKRAVSGAAPAAGRAARKACGSAIGPKRSRKSKVAAKRT